MEDSQEITLFGPEPTNGSIKSGPAPDPDFESGLLTVGAGAAARKIAFLSTPGASERGTPGFVWLGGFRSTMRGQKASYLHEVAAAAGRSFLRFDYSGHGDSEGAFERGTIGRWLEESLAAVRTLTWGPQILVGSSMGGWLALLLARALHEAGEGGRLAALTLIAPAVDFTQALIFERMSRRERAELASRGVWLRPSRYGEPYPITRELIEEGRGHLLFGGAIRSHCPVHVIQGMRDEDVPFRHALTLVEHMPGDPVALTLVRDGDHQLSRPQDLELIWAAAQNLRDLDSGRALV